jgi:hypothetical protein
MTGTDCPLSLLDIVRRLVRREVGPQEMIHTVVVSISVTLQDFRNGELASLQWQDDSLDLWSIWRKVHGINHHIVKITRALETPESERLLLQLINEAFPIYPIRSDSGSLPFPIGRLRQQVATMADVQ